MVFKKNKTILLLGGGPEQLAAIEESKKLGYNVICADRNNHCVGRKYSNFFYKISIKDINKLLKIFEKHKISGVASICSDLAVPIVSSIGEKFQLFCLNSKQSEILTNKLIMKKFFKRNKIKSPEFFLHNNLKKTVKFIKKKN